MAVHKNRTLTFTSVPIRLYGPSGQLRGIALVARQGNSARCPLWEADAGIRWEIVLYFNHGVQLSVQLGMDHLSRLRLARAGPAQFDFGREPWPFPVRHGTEGRINGHFFSKDIMGTHSAHHPTVAPAGPRI